jgi:hypothetical protein
VSERPKGLTSVWNLDVFGFSLNDEEIARLDELLTS